jgi:hypothetical protein
MSWKPADDMSEEDIQHEKEKCLLALAEMHNQVKAWRESLVRNARERAPKEGYEGWDFLAEELQDSINTHVWPYASRFYQCGYMDQTEVWSYLGRIEEQAEELRKDLEDLAEEGRRIEKERNSLKARIKRKLQQWLA